MHRHPPRSLLGAALAAAAVTTAAGNYQFILQRKVVNTSVADGEGAHLLSAARSSAAPPLVSGIPGRERGRRLQEEVIIGGDFRQLAYFYTDVFVGTPPQKASVITDTGENTFETRLERRNGRSS